MVVAIVTAGGIGTRMKSQIPKQFIEIKGKPLIIYTLESISSNLQIEKICVVCHKDWISYMNDLLAKYNIKKIGWIVEGGETGIESIYNGVKCVKDDCDCILIHDGNRPLISNEIIDDAISVYKDNGNAIAAIPCVEVVFESDGHIAKNYIDREKIRRTQTPHVISTKEFIVLYEKAKKEGIKGIVATCDLLFLMGKPVYFSKGSVFNFKVTFPDDVKLFESIINVIR